MEKSIERAERYLVLGADVDFVGLEKETELAKKIYLNTFEYYSYSSGERSFLVGCMAGDIYNNFNLYGQYLSDYSFCVRSDCEGIKLILTKINLIQEDLKNEIGLCRNVFLSEK